MLPITTDLRNYLYVHLFSGLLLFLIFQPYFLVVAPQYGFAIFFGFCYAKRRLYRKIFGFGLFVGLWVSQVFVFVVIDFVLHWFFDLRGFHAWVKESLVVYVVYACFFAIASAAFFYRHVRMYRR